MAFDRWPSLVDFLNDVMRQGDGPHDTCAAIAAHYGGLEAFVSHIGRRVGQPDLQVFPPVEWLTDHAAAPDLIELARDHSTPESLTADLGTVAAPDREQGLLMPAFVLTTDTLVCRFVCSAKDRGRVAAIPRFTVRAGRSEWTPAEARLVPSRWAEIEVSYGRGDSRTHELGRQVAQALGQSASELRPLLSGDLGQALAEIFLLDDQPDAHGKGLGRLLDLLDQHASLFSSASELKRLSELRNGIHDALRERAWRRLTNVGDECLPGGEPDHVRIVDWVFGDKPKNFVVGIRFDQYAHEHDASRLLRGTRDCEVEVSLGPYPPFAREIEHWMREFPGAQPVLEDAFHEMIELGEDEREVRTPERLDQGCPAAVLIRLDNRLRERYAEEKPGVSREDFEGLSNKIGTTLRTKLGVEIFPEQDTTWSIEEAWVQQWRSDGRNWEFGDDLARAEPAFCLLRRLFRAGGDLPLQKGTILVGLKQQASLISLLSATTGQLPSELARGCEAIIGCLRRRESAEKSLHDARAAARLLLQSPAVTQKLADEIGHYFHTLRRVPPDDFIDLTKRDTPQPYAVKPVHADDPSDSAAKCRVVLPPVRYAVERAGEIMPGQVEAASTRLEAMLAHQDHAKALDLYRGYTYDGKIEWLGPLREALVDILGCPEPEADPAAQERRRLVRDALVHELGAKPVDTVAQDTIQSDCFQTIRLDCEGSAASVDPYRKPLRFDDGPWVVKGDASVSVAHDPLCDELTACAKAMEPRGGPPDFDKLRRTIAKCLFCDQVLPRNLRFPPHAGDVQAWLPRLIDAHGTDPDVLAFIRDVWLTQAGPPPGLVYAHVLCAAVHDLETQLLDDPSVLPPEIVSRFRARTSELHRVLARFSASHRPAEELQARPIDLYDPALRLELAPAAQGPKDEPVFFDPNTCQADIVRVRHAPVEVDGECLSGHAGEAEYRPFGLRDKVLDTLVATLQQIAPTGHKTAAEAADRVAEQLTAACARPRPGGYDKASLAEALSEEGWAELGRNAWIVLEAWHTALGQRLRSRPDDATALAAAKEPVADNAPAHLLEVYGITCAASAQQAKKLDIRDDVFSPEVPQGGHILLLPSFHGTSTCPVLPALADRSLGAAPRPLEILIGLTRTEAGLAKALGQFALDAERRLKEEAKQAGEADVSEEANATLVEALAAAIQAQEQTAADISTSIDDLCRCLKARTGEFECLLLHDNVLDRVSRQDEEGTLIGEDTRGRRTFAARFEYSDSDLAVKGAITACDRRYWAFRGEVRSEGKFVVSRGPRPSLVVHLNAMLPWLDQQQKPKACEHAAILLDRFEKDFRFPQGQERELAQAACPIVDALSQLAAAMRLEHGPSALPEAALKFVKALCEAIDAECIPLPDEPLPLNLIAARNFTCGEHDTPAPLQDFHDTFPARYCFDVQCTGVPRFGIKADARISLGPPDPLAELFRQAFPEALVHGNERVREFFAGPRDAATDYEDYEDLVQLVLKGDATLAARMVGFLKSKGIVVFPSYVRGAEERTDLRTASDKAARELGITRDVLLCNIPSFEMMPFPEAAERRRGLAIAAHSGRFFLQRQGERVKLLRAADETLAIENQHGPELDKLRDVVERMAREFTQNAADQNPVFREILATHVQQSRDSFPFGDVRDPEHIREDPTRIRTIELLKACGGTNVLPILLELLEGGKRDADPRHGETLWQLLVIDHFADYAVRRREPADVRNEWNDVLKCLQGDGQSWSFSRDPRHRIGGGVHKLPTCVLQGVTHTYRSEFGTDVPVLFVLGLDWE